MGVVAVDVDADESGGLRVGSKKLVCRAHVFLILGHQPPREVSLSISDRLELHVCRLGKERGECRLSRTSGYGAPQSIYVRGEGRIGARGKGTGLRKRTRLGGRCGWGRGGGCGRGRAILSGSCAGVPRNGRVV